MRCFTILLLTGMLLQTFSRQIIVADFLINRDYITKVLCINRDQPEKHCNGKCHLKVELDHDNNRQKSNQQNSPSGFEYQFITPDLADLRFEMDPGTKMNFRYQESSAQRIATSVFHPPGEADFYC